MDRRKLLAGCLSTIGGAFILPHWLKEKDSKPKNDSFLPERVKICEENVAKALEILKNVGHHTKEEADKIRQDICKRMPEVRNHRNRFLNFVWQFGTISDYCDITALWDAICVTFRTHGQVDGFSVIDYELPSDIRKVDNIANRGVLPGTVYEKIQGGLIDPIQPIWGKMGEWVLYQS